jgi:hypothetical protein
MLRSYTPDSDSINLEWGIYMKNFKIFLVDSNVP